VVVHEIERAKSMQGVSLHNVRLTAFQCAADDVDIAKMPTKDAGRGIPGKRPQAPVIEKPDGRYDIYSFWYRGVPSRCK